MRATNVASAPRARDTGLNGPVEGAHRRRLGDLAQLRRGGVLALGEAVDPVVEQQDLEVHVAAQRVDQVVAADGQRVAVTGDDPHRQVRPRGRQPGRDRRRAAVDRVHAVGVHVVREPARAADARDEHDVLPAQPQLGQEALHRGEDRVVPAPGAPAHLLVGLEVLGRLLGVRLGHEPQRRHPGQRGQRGVSHEVLHSSSLRGRRCVSVAIRSVMTFASSSALNGRPRTLVVARPRRRGTWRGPASRAGPGSSPGRAPGRTPAGRRRCWRGTG